MDDERSAFQEELVRLAVVEGIGPDYAESYYRMLFEIATGLASRTEKLLIVGIAGSQGSGKSTLAKLLATVLERVYEKNSLVMSVDDFYLTREERRALGRDVHPMLSTRGVPGTHDIALMQSVIDDLKTGKNTEVPHFDKAEDDRGGFTPVVSRELSLLIIEGWCWGAMPAEGDELDHPVNALEQEDDEDGRWRRYVDRQLTHGGYQEVFAEAHTCLFLSVPNMEAVVRWRWQQEQRLAEARSDGTKIMTEPEVRRFIMYYERITRRMLEKMPKRANMTFYLDDQHRIGPPPR
ncbi:MAG: kinase [Pseudomonadota bacterium]|nr:kinase [Pseudomonadota bacterium]